MLDEHGGKMMTEYVALWEKTYAYRKPDKKLEDKHCICKGTEKFVVTKSLTFDDYKTSLLDGRIIHGQQMLLRIRNTWERLVQADVVTMLAREYLA